MVPRARSSPAHPCPPLPTPGAKHLAAGLWIPPCSSPGPADSGELPQPVDPCGVGPAVRGKSSTEPVKARWNVTVRIGRSGIFS